MDSETANAVAVEKARCTICGHQGVFLNKERGKEGWQCPNCSASSRNRMVMLALGAVLGFGDLPVYLWPRNKRLRVLEPCPRGPQVVFLREKFDYYEPEYDAAKIESGADPRRYADLQRLLFQDATFDIIIASDVFEHVRDDAQGFREVYRTLKPGGTFILTSPYDHEREKTLVRVQVNGDRDIPLMEPRYAGGGGTTLDYREYGRDLLDLLRGIGFAVAYTECDLPRFGIHRYGVILCQKSSYIDLRNLWPSPSQSDARIRPLGPLFLFRLFVFFKFNLKSLPHFLREARRKLTG